METVFLAVASSASNMEERIPPLEGTVLEPGGGRRQHRWMHSSRGRAMKVRTAMMCGYGTVGLNWVVIPVMMLLMIALLVVLGWALVHWLNRKTRRPVPHDYSPLADEPPALEVLQQRYARGDIDTATFENMRERLVASSRRDNTL
jgi:uncharacterized membrane protein